MAEINFRDFMDESLRSWLLGGNEGDKYFPLIPPVSKSPEKLLELYKGAQKAEDKPRLDKIKKDLAEMGYSVKVLYILSKDMQE